MQKTSIFEFVGKNIVPEKWEYCGYYMFYTFENVHGEKDSDVELNITLPDGCPITERELLQAHEEQSHCNCCGHRIKRGSFFYNSDTKKFIYVGFDCAKSILSLRFDVKNAKKQTLAARKRQIVLNNIDMILNDNEGLDEALTKWNKIVREISEKFYKFGKISIKQIDLVFKLAKEREKYESTAKEALSGKIEDKFTIVSIKDIPDSAYNKILVEHADGWKAWGNINKELSEKFTKLQKINIKATFQVSDKDKYFAFFKRPSFKETIEIF